MYCFMLCTVRAVLDFILWELCCLASAVVQYYAMSVLYVLFVSVIVMFCFALSGRSFLDYKLLHSKLYCILRCRCCYCECAVLWEFCIVCVMYCEYVGMWVCCIVSMLYLNCTLYIIQCLAYLCSSFSLSFLFTFSSCCRLRISFKRL